MGWSWASVVVQALGLPCRTQHLVLVASVWMVLVEDWGLVAA
jgi:hypothetical protein